MININSYILIYTKILVTRILLYIVHEGARQVCYFQFLTYNLYCK